MKTLFFILVKFFSLPILTRGEKEFCCNDGKTSLTREKVGFKKKERTQACGFFTTYGSQTIVAQHVWPCAIQRNQF